MNNSLHLKDICNQTQIKKINKWINDFKGGIIKPLYIYGLSGCGKTCLANIILEKCNYNIINLSSIYINNNKNILETINNVLINKSICMMFSDNISCKGLIIDDLEHYIEYDKHIYNAIMIILKNIGKYDNNPIIIISNKINKKVHQYLDKQCVTINIKYTRNKVVDIIKYHIDNSPLNMDSIQINKIIVQNKNNLTSIFEQIKYLEESNIKSVDKSNNVSLDEENITKINYNNEIDNELIEYLKVLFKIEFGNDTISDIYREVNYDVNTLILLILENSLKYVHNCSNKNYKKSIDTICKIYNNISLSDNYEYLKIMNSDTTYNDNYNNYIILHGIVIPIYSIYKNNNNKKQFNFKDTSIYSKSIIEVYNTKKKISIESISTRLKNTKNCIKIYHHAIITDNIKIIEWCEYILKNDIVIYKDLIKYIKYVTYKVYGYKIK